MLPTATLRGPNLNSVSALIVVHHLFVDPVPPPEAFPM